MTELKIAKLTGSEKQIAWATDIIAAPYNTVISLAESYAKKFAEYGLQDFEVRATIYREAAEMYKTEYEKISDQMTEASRVIEYRKNFAGIINEIIHQVAVSHNAIPTDVYRI